jgi:hypothetical protein
MCGESPDHYDSAIGHAGLILVRRFFHARRELFANAAIASSRVETFKAERAFDLFFWMTTSIFWTAIV